MGLGITKALCLDVITAILQTKIEQKDFVYPSMMVLDRILKNNKDLVNLLKGNAIDPAQVQQADINVRDAVFTKIGNYIRLLYKTEKLPWETFGQISKENIYNMDEMATETSKHQK